MKNKILSILLALLMLISLASCTDKTGEETPVGDVNVPESDKTPDTQQTPQTETVMATVEETVMWDGNDIKVTALSLTSDNYYHILNLKIENKTSKDLYVMASRTAVNSFVVEPTMGVDVPANSTAEGQFKVRLKDVAAKTVADIETRFSYASPDRYISTSTERVKLNTSAAESFDYSYDESGTVLYDANGIKIICQGFNDEGNPMIYLSSTGELSEGCCVEDYEVYVNGRKTYSDYCQWVFTNTRNLAEMDIDDKDVDGNELGELESLKVSFRINKENMADRSPVKTELVEIPVK